MGYPHPPAIVWPTSRGGSAGPPITPSASNPITTPANACSVGWTWTAVTDGVAGPVVVTAAFSNVARRNSDGAVAGPVVAGLSPNRWRAIASAWSGSTSP